MKTRAAIFAAALLALVPCAAQVAGGVGKNGTFLELPLPNFSVDEPLAAIEDHLLKREGYLFPPGKKDRTLRPLSVIERELRPARRLVRKNDFVVVGGMGNRILRADEGSEADEANPVAGQMLEFADGGRLHGTLEGLDGVKREIVWRGADASAPLTFPLAQVSHLEFATKEKPAAKVHATVQLAGGDWLTADVTGLRDGRLQLRLGDGTALAVERTRIEWVYFSKTAAPECYDGPQNMSGWVSNGGWIYRDGALRATQPSSVGRMFETLPDQVEYRFEFDQGESPTRVFAVLLHGPDAAVRGLGAGMVRLMINDMTLQLWAQREDSVKQEQADLSKILPAPPKTAEGTPVKRKPSRWRIFEDRVSGRLVVFIDGRKAADWNTGKGRPGENRGSLIIQPMSGAAEQSLAKIRVAPWDGYVPVDDAMEGVRARTDQVVLVGGDRSEGRIESIMGDKVKVGTALLAREKVMLLRFAKPETVPDEDSAVARVRLAQGGEFDAAAVAYQDGKLRVRTNFGGEAVLPLAALRGVEFAHLAPVPGKSTDTLVFKNGDRLGGTLATAASGQRLRWRAAPATPPVEMDTARVAGVLVAPRGAPPPARTGVLARCRNGDCFAGDLVGLDAQQLTLESGAAGRVALPRAAVQAVYFSHDGRLPVLDGATEHEVWEAGLDFNRATAEQRKKKPADGKAVAGLWSYFDGMFSVKRPAVAKTNAYNNGSFNLGRVVEGLPARVDFSFEVIGKKNQVFFSAYLFTEPDSPGYMMQFHQAGLFLYDTGAPQQRGRGAVQQQQIQFGDKVKADVAQHRVRVLADRLTGRMTILVDEVVVANFGPKTGAPPRNLARGLGLLPQQNTPVTFANLRVAPWNGQVPGKAPVAGAPSDTVLLANGDEAQGAVGSATPETLQIEAEVGGLELPVKRLAMVEFGARAAETASGVRLRLGDGSVFTVSGYRIENDTVVCQSAVAGEIRLPLGAVRELVFAAATPPAAPAPLRPDAKPGGVRGNAGIIID